MKVGSLVECIDNSPNPKNGYINEAIYPQLKTVYTVRELRSDTSTILLEEIDNSKLAPRTIYRREPGFAIKKFRELQPPISNIEEHINENTLEPELV